MGAATIKINKISYVASRIIAMTYSKSINLFFPRDKSRGHNKSLGYKYNIPQKYVVPRFIAVIG